LFKYGEERSIARDCTYEKKINFEGVTQNGCYGNQPQLFEVLVYSIDANSYCPFTKQDLVFKQAYLVSFCSVLCNKLKFSQLTLVFRSFYRLYLQITLFCTKPSEQIN